MRNLLQRALNRQDPAPPRSWERPINTAALRHAAAVQECRNRKSGQHREECESGEHDQSDDIELNHRRRS